MLFFGKKTHFRKLKLKKPSVFYLPGFHADPVGHKTQAETVEHGFSLIRQQLLACRSDQYYGVYLSELDFLKPYLDLFPEEKQFIAKLVEQERCASGGAYNQPNETSISGEALIRNLALGREIRKALLGDSSQVYMAWDSYGHVPQLPQILTQCGLHAVVFSRGDYGDPAVDIPGVPELFRWIAPNGTEALARRIDYRAPEELSVIEECIRRHEKMNRRIPELAADLLIDAADMRSPRTYLIGRCRELAEHEHPVVVTGAAAEKYFSAVETLVHAGKLHLEPVTRDLTQGYEGCELSRLDLKTANRMVETLLFEAECWGALAGRYGVSYPSAGIDHAWRQLLFCQHHHGVTGFCSDISMIELLGLYRETLEETAALRSRILADMVTVIDTANVDGEPLHVFNCLPWRRDGVCKLTMEINADSQPLALYALNGEEIPYELENVLSSNRHREARVTLTWLSKQLPSAGYETLLLRPKEDVEFPYIKKMQSQHWLENEFFRIEIDQERGGGIVSIYDKLGDYEFVSARSNSPANDIVIMQESDSDSPLSELHTVGGKERASRFPAEVEYYESEVSQRLIIRGDGPGDCKRVQEIRLYKESPYIDCVTVLDNYNGHELEEGERPADRKRDLYTAVFPLNLPGAIPVLEDRFYAKAWRRSGRNLDFRSGAWLFESQHALNSCYRWVDVSWTFLARFVDNQDEVASVAVGPSEIVTGSDKHRDARERLMKHLAKHGVTASPRYDRDEVGADRLFRQCSFCIGAKEENAYTRTLLERSPEANDYYERNVKEIGYVCLAVEDAVDGYRVPVFIFAGRSHALTAHAVDELIQTTVAHRWDLPASACFLARREIVEDAGFALLNKGNTLCTLEEDGTLALALMHTAPPLSAQTNWRFDFAEQKTHVFQYRLIPHQGDWRMAEIPRRAMEYQHSPSVRTNGHHEGILPTKISFLSVEPSNILVSAVKPAGFPEAAFKKTPDSPDSMVLRLYEMYGEESNIWIETRDDVRGALALQADESAFTGKRDIILEEKVLRSICHANEISTMQVNFKPPEARPKAVVSAQEPAKPVYPVRYWRLNRGAAPPGLMPLSLSFRGRVNTESYHSRDRVHYIELVVVNHSQVFRQGEIKLSVPPYWRTVPDRPVYKLQANSFQIIPVNLIMNNGTLDGFIRARVDVDGLVLEDLLHVGLPPEFDLAMTLTHESFNIHLKHNHPYETRGTLTIISPVETWGREMVDDFALTSVKPFHRTFTVLPGAETVLDFPVTDYLNRYNVAADHHWFVIKLAAHDVIRYYHVRLDGKPSFGIGCMIYPPYDEKEE